MLVEPNYTAAVSEPFFDPAACHRAAIRACIGFRRRYWQAVREGNAIQAAKELDNLNWYRKRATLWKAMAKAELEADDE